MFAMLVVSVAGEAGAADSILVGFDSGTPARVKQISPPFNSGNSPLRDFYPFGMAFTGGVRVAMGDVNGDGTPDLVCATGPGGDLVNIYSGVDGGLLWTFNAFNGVTTGIFVAAGDVNGDGYADIVIGSETGDVPTVKVYSGFDHAVLGEFAAFAVNLSTG